MEIKGRQKVGGGMRPDGLEIFEYLPGGEQVAMSAEECDQFLRPPVCVNPTPPAPTFKVAGQIFNKPGGK
jgi:hypothetical protein